MIRHLVAALAILATLVLLALGWPSPMAAVGGVVAACMALAMFLRSVKGS